MSASASRSAASGGNAVPGARRAEVVGSGATAVAAVSSAQAAAQQARKATAAMGAMLDLEPAGAAEAGASIANIGNLMHSKVHPRMLHSAATSHSWPFAAVAELVDNAQDAECGASTVWVHAEADGFFKNRGVVVVEDDGTGLTRDAMVRMMSYGFSDKENAAGNVGRYGVGFKSGSMRLGQDALVISKSIEGTATVALLSRTFLDELKVDEIMIPMFTWTMHESAPTPGQSARHKPTQTFERLAPANATEWSRNLQVLKRFSPLDGEDALLDALRALKSTTGTAVWCYNMRQPAELETTEDNITIVKVPDAAGGAAKTGAKGNFKLSRENQMDSANVPEDYSLRAYLSVLYLRPRVTIYLQGSLVEPQCPIERLDKEKHTFPSYTPRMPAVNGERAVNLEAVKVTLGYSSNTGKLYGVHIYNRNRLINMYKRYGAMLQSNCMWKTMLGVVEADCLTPSHSKQEFDESQQIYHKVKAHVQSTMRTYYEDIQQVCLAGLAGRGSAARLANDAARAKGIVIPPGGLKPRRTEEDSSDVVVTVIAGLANRKKGDTGRRAMGINPSKRKDNRKPNTQPGNKEEEESELEEDDEEEAAPVAREQPVARSGGGAGRGGRGRGRGNSANAWPAAVAGGFTEVDKNTWWGECTVLLRSLRNDRGYKYFEQPVDPVALGCFDYLDVIERPMSFAQIHLRLDACVAAAAVATAAAAAAAAAVPGDDDYDAGRRANPKRQKIVAVKPYACAREFAVDVVQVFQNAVLYNPSHHEVYLRAVALFNSFHGRWQEAVIRPPFATQNDVVGQELLLRLPGQDKGANTKKRAAQEANDSDGGANGNGGAGGALFRLRDVAPGRATPPTTHATVKVGALAPKKKSVTQPGLGDAESSDDDTALVAVAADHVSRTQVSLKADSLQLKKKLKAAEEGRLVLEKQNKKLREEALRLTTTTGELKAQLATERGRAKERAAQLEAAAATVRETAQLKSQLTRERAISTELAKKQRKLEEQLEARPAARETLELRAQLAREVARTAELSADLEELRRRTPAPEVLVID